jgi:hypothetical protein
VGVISQRRSKKLGNIREESRSARQSGINENIGGGNGEAGGVMVKIEAAGIEMKIEKIFQSMA